jgi:hypothetical protein
MKSKQTTVQDGDYLGKGKQNAQNGLVWRDIYKASRAVLSQLSQNPTRAVAEIEEERRQLVDLLLRRKDLQTNAKAREEVESKIVTANQMLVPEKGLRYLADNYHDFEIVEKDGKKYVKPKKDTCIPYQVLDILQQILYEINIEQHNNSGTGLREVMKGEIKENPYKDIEKKMAYNVGCDRAGAWKKDAALIVWNSTKAAEMITKERGPKKVKVIEMIDRFIKYLRETDVYIKISDDIHGEFYRGVPLVQELAHDIPTDSKKDDVLYLWLHPIFTQALKAQKGENFVNCLPMREVAQVLGNSPVEWRLYNYCRTQYSYIFNESQKLAKDGKTVQHRVNARELLERVAGGARINGRNNKSARIFRTIDKALQKMITLRMILPNTIHARKNKAGAEYIWEWSPDFYFKEPQTEQKV